MTGSSKHTALHDIHAELGASFTDFGGWDMPLKYGSELTEHRAVRSAAGIFDLSHMGEVRLTGPGAAAALDYALISRLSAIKPGRAKYTVIVNEQGKLLDDLIVYRLGEEEFLVVPNAGNAVRVAAELARRAESFDVTVADESAETSLIAVQGPAAESILLELVAAEDAEAVRSLKYYAAVTLAVSGIEVLLARTGYTGEDGFELFLPNAQAPALWRAVVEAGTPHGLIPAGLAARDSLRLEAGMPLYGNELTTELTPFEAGLGRMIPFDSKEDFVGREALEPLRGTQPARVLVGLASQGRRAARQGSAVLVDGEVVGVVTSGQPSPTLGHPIALAYVDSAHAEPGTAVQADVRGKVHDFEVVALPFYRRKKD
ncbi:glycine cleavage system aminomethyltransferase GcvT [Sediminivirga luteola]|uniref:Aminomethyltransferase n=1 Tax=Sediminivirga luteola TaxID=1774748 RepID=A0A8J2TWA5_9MICO|nr:glycine cleavage system aminomethyltransferase GcvT [Sediminivirga luteola]MCI2264437.1 glycine cleavage system aminomethyltransferase GcvT [Sediminivirga luteola]GGA06168.1 aminomethyltransferase [Sediminivirga luteola]